MTTVASGLDRVVSGEVKALHGKRIGLLVNPTAVDRELRHAIDLLAAMPGVTLSCLFGPEHGVRGDAQDMISVSEARDSVSGLPMYSLYGDSEASLRPRPEWLEGLDAVVYDIQDVGSRYYTYVWTLLHVMEVAGPKGVEVIVLDRPNPIGGEVEGGAIRPEYRSFVGRVSLPNRHGLTVGEIARMVNERERLGVRLTVIEARGWRREMYFDQTGLPWVQPSPNMPTLETALVYPGGCLIEGTELSEGRGTTRPFEYVGAPFLSYRDAHALCDGLSALGLGGVRFRPAVFQPTFQKFAGKRCGGVAVHVHDRAAFRPYLAYVALIAEIRRRFPGQFKWRTRAYEFVADKPAIDLLAGGPELRELIDAGAKLDDIAASWRAAEDAFRAERAAWMIYP